MWRNLEWWKSLYLYLCAKHFFCAKIISFWYYFLWKSRFLSTLTFIITTYCHVSTYIPQFCPQINYYLFSYFLNLRSHAFWFNYTTNSSFDFLFIISFFQLQQFLLVIRFIKNSIRKFELINFDILYEQFLV